MPKPKWKLNTIYISERLQESLRPISRCALTTVVAPMGYGKTTAVNWYLEERAKAGPLRVVRISVYSDNLAIFWRSAQDAFARAGIDPAFYSDREFGREEILPWDIIDCGVSKEFLLRERDYINLQVT